jgi:2-isopropylmalate synthase
LQVELSSQVQTITEDTGTEISPAEMWAVFKENYLPEAPRIELRTYETTTTQEGAAVTAQLVVDGDPRTITADGNGPIAAFVHALRSGLGIDVEVLDYAEHAVSAGEEATAAAYVEVRDADGTVRWGVGLDESILTASLKAVLCGVNRLGLSAS